MAMRYGYFDSEITGVDSEGMPILTEQRRRNCSACSFPNC